MMASWYLPHIELAGMSVPMITRDTAMGGWKGNFGIENKGKAAGKNSLVVREMLGTFVRALRVK